MDDLRGVLEASPDAVLVVDDEGVIRRANRHVPEVLGYSPEELEGEAVEELLLEADREHHVRFRREYMEDPEPRPMGNELDLYALREDGASIPVEISLGPVERDGERYVVTTISGISERRERERELERQNERLEEFASIVSHHLRNPLSVAAGRLELAREEREGEHLDAIGRSLERMEVLIDDLLTLAQEGETVEETEPVALDEVVEECWRNVETGGASLVVETERAVRVDRPRLQQLVENLLRNAVEHGSTSDRGGSDDVAEVPSTSNQRPVGADDAVKHGGEAVTVEVGNTDDGFYVEDDGRGLPTDGHGRLFERGYSTSQEGTGFGLAIVEEVAEAHGWRVRATESDSGGARFEVTGVAFARE